MRYCERCGKEIRIRKKCMPCYVALSRIKLKKMAVEYKGSKCQCCGYNKCVASLAFHHLDPSQKDFSLGHGNTTSWNKVKKEIDKCILVCMNCHGEIHYGIRTIDNASLE